VGGWDATIITGRPDPTGETSGSDGAGFFMDWKPFL